MGTSRRLRGFRHMLLVALASDYDGTLATDGQVHAPTLEALKRFKASGRKLILVTGRELPDLNRVFPDLPLFDAVVAENGALLYLPGTAEERPLSPPPPPEFVAALKARGVEPLSVGRSIVATWEPNEGKVLEAIHDLGLEWHIIFNKGAVMCLPPGVTKASGLAAALEELELSPLNVLGVGDAENDHAFLMACGCSAAVANALPALKAEVDVVTAGARGAGVQELIDRILGSAPDAVPIRIARHDVELGADRSGRAVPLSADDGALLIAGHSGAGKSRLATALIERLLARGHQVCIVDPEGEHGQIERTVTLGDPSTAPSEDEAMAVLRRPQTSVVLNLLAMPIGERPRFFAALEGRLGELRASAGRPHWIVLDEAHHLAPAQGEAGVSPLPSRLPGAIFITPSPDCLSAAALKATGVVAAVGPRAAEIVAEVRRATGEAGATADAPTPGDDEVLFWRRGEAPVLVQAPQPKGEHQRHVRKYAEGELGEDKSFFFRGPDGALNLRAQNLMIFLQIGEGVDDRTWLHHLRRRDYSRWFRESLADDELADEAERIETEDADDPAESRKAIRELVSRRYTASAGA